VVDVDIDENVGDGDIHGDDDIVDDVGEISFFGLLKGWTVSISWNDHGLGINAGKFDDDSDVGDDIFVGFVICDGGIR